ncbi:hypothetical protein T492DRAFT_862936 [Pavlovales sp. CCMP2436]|nr:hypothetical protein T492DRAFT_862936 [Pavlovales sp. CCMP2436]
MQQLMLAQAQKTIYEKAEKDGMKQTLVAKIARHAALTYEDVLRRMNAPKLKANLDRGWPLVADWQWHASMEAEEAHSYGLQVGRLNVAHEKLSGE